MTPIVRPERVKSARPFAGARRTNYSRLISMTRPRINALRSAKGRHYRALYVPTSTWSTHSWSPETARTMPTRGPGKVLWRATKGDDGLCACVYARVNHRRVRRIRPTRTLIQSRRERGANSRSPRARNYRQLRARRTIKSDFRVHARHTCDTAGISRCGKTHGIASRDAS